MSKYVYIKVTNDEYELIEAISDSPKELAEETNYTVGSVYSSVTRSKNKNYRKAKDGSDYYLPFRKVRID